MSLYNIVYGINPATFFILPMIAERHPESYPRFRDCFAGELSRDYGEPDMFGIPSIANDISKRIISVYTRVGGGNREDYQKEINEMRAIPGFIRDFDDEFDSTFATFEYKVPEEFEVDYDLILNGELSQTSNTYKERVYKVFPKLKEQLDNIFTQKEERDE